MEITNLKFNLSCVWANRQSIDRFKMAAAQTTNDAPDEDAAELQFPKGKMSLAAFGKCHK